MSTVRCIYHGAEPNFPATDQHPDAARFYVIDGEVYSADAWASMLAAATAAALVAVFGSADPAAMQARMASDVEQRGALKSQLAAENEARVPKPSHIVDAIGEPTIAEIDAVLNPPPV